MCDAGGVAYLLLLAADELQEEWCGLAEIADLDLKLWQEPLGADLRPPAPAEAIQHQSSPSGTPREGLRGMFLRVLRPENSKPRGSSRSSGPKSGARPAVRSSSSPQALWEAAHLFLSPLEAVTGGQETLRASCSMWSLWMEGMSSYLAP